MHHEKVVPDKRAVSSIVLDDGTESIRAVLFHEILKKMGITEFQNPETLSMQKEDVLGREMIFSGNVRDNAFFNTPEFIVNDVKEVNVDEVIVGLENKV